MSEWIKILDPDPSDEVDEQIPELIRLDDVISVYHDDVHDRYFVMTNRFRDHQHWHQTDGIIRTNPFQKQEAGND